MIPPEASSTLLAPFRRRPPQIWFLLQPWPTTTDFMGPMTGPPTSFRPPYSKVRLRIHRSTAPVLSGLLTARSKQPHTSAPRSPPMAPPPLISICASMQLSAHLLAGLRSPRRLDRHPAPKFLPAAPTTIDSQPSTSHASAPPLPYAHSSVAWVPLVEFVATFTPAPPARPCE